VIENADARDERPLNVFLALAMPNRARRVAGEISSNAMLVRTRHDGQSVRAMVGLSA